MQLGMTWEAMIETALAPPLDFTLPEVPFSSTWLAEQGLGAWWFPDFAPEELIARLWASAVGRLPAPGLPGWLREWYGWSVSLGRALVWLPLPGTAAAGELARSQPALVTVLGGDAEGVSRVPVAWGRPSPKLAGMAGPVLASKVSRLCLWEGETVIVPQGLGAVERKEGLAMFPLDYVEPVDFQRYAVDGRAVARARATGALLWGAWLWGAAVAGLLLARRRLLERHQFGRPLARFQATRHQMVDLAVALEPQADLFEAALRAYQEGPEDFIQRANLAAARAMRLSHQVLKACALFWGGYSFLQDYPPSRYTLATRIFEPVAGEAHDLEEEAIGTLSRSEGKAGESQL
ncbi:MAG: hypothetical protein K6U87_10665 [Firmicutes bacterium]|nr:hypothetical protein [Bacillota bacterium]